MYRQILISVIFLTLAACESGSNGNAASSTGSQNTTTTNPANYDGLWEITYAPFIALCNNGGELNVGEIKLTENLYENYNPPYNIKIGAANVFITSTGAATYPSSGYTTVNGISYVHNENSVLKFTNDDLNLIEGTTIYDYISNWQSSGDARYKCTGTGTVRLVRL